MKRFYNKMLEKHRRRRNQYIKRYRRRNFYGYECKFEIWGKSNRRWVGWADDPQCGDAMYMQLKKYEPFNLLESRIKTAIRNAVELEALYNEEPEWAL